MMTNPFIGLTAKLLCIVVPPEFNTLSLAQQYQYLDEQLVAWINDGLLDDNSQLSPLPLLGIPTWHTQAQDLTFYQNTDYFRPKRRK